METTTLTDTVLFDCTPEVTFHAWLDSKEHGEMVESSGVATIDPNIGGEFAIWDNAIVGKTIMVDDNDHKIVQEWRYSYEDWPKNKPSTLTLEFHQTDDGKTKLELQQTNVPKQYAKEIAEGWDEYYWQPMKRYFSAK